MKKHTVGEGSPGSGLQASCLVLDPSQTSPPLAPDSPSAARAVEPPSPPPVLLLSLPLCKAEKTLQDRKHLPRPYHSHQNM